MHAARHFTASVQTLDRGVSRGADHLGVVVDHHAAHGVVNLRADFNAVERGLGNVQTLVELQNAVEVLVSAFLHEVVELLDFGKERVLLDAEMLGQSFESVELLDRAHFERQTHEGRVDGFDDGVVADGDRVVLVVADDLEHGVSLDLAAGVFVHEALAGLAVDHEAQVHASVVGEVHGNTEALFVGVAVGKELQPAQLNRSGADAQSLDQHAGSSTGLVGGVGGGHHARILNLTEPDVAGEAAGGEHDAELGANGVALAGLVFQVVAHELVVEAVAGTIGNAENFTLVVAHDEVVELGTGANNDVLDLLQFGVHRTDVAGARTRLDFVGAGNGVAAFKEHVVGHEFATAVNHHLDRVVATISDRGKQVGVVDAETIAQAVFNEEFLAVLDALSLLNRIAGAGNVAAADGGVAADDAHLFEHQHAQTGATGLESAGHAGKTGTDDDDVEFFFIRLDGGSGDAGIGSSSGHDGAGGGDGRFQKTAAGSVNVFHGESFCGCLKCLRKRLVKRRGCEEQFLLLCVLRPGVFAFQRNSQPMRCRSLHPAGCIPRDVVDA